MKRILFVDDESAILDGIRRMLRGERDRWDMHFAVGGEAALRACEVDTFDVVVSDMRMPGMDGATLLSQIRDRYPGTARLVLSGYAETKLATRASGVAYRVLGKPCEAPELKSTVERVCTLQDLFCTPEMRQIVGTIGKLPSLSTTCQALAEAVQNPCASVSGIADIIEQDIAMSAKVLQLVNSGFFGPPHRTTSVQHAAAYLGMEAITHLATTTDVFTVFTPDERLPADFSEDVHRCAQRVANIVRALPLDQKIRDVTVMAALLQQIGKLVIASKLPDAFCAVASVMKGSGCRQFEAEEQVLGISHAKIGAYLLGLWGINSVAVEAIANHHSPTGIPHSGFDSSAALYVANLLAEELETHPDDVRGNDLRESDRVCLETLGVWQQFLGFRERALEALKKQADRAAKKVEVGSFQWR